MQLNRPTIAAIAGVAALVLGGGALALTSGDDPPPTTTTTTTTSTTTTSTTSTTVPFADRSALTGLGVPDDVRTRPVVAIKYDNVDGRATPQAGINSADVVYEIQVEGQITRLLALFQSADVSNVGPVRSARGSEVPVLEELNRPLFTWHGANDILRAAVRNSSIQPRSIDDIPQLFYRDGGRRAPYNSFVVGTAEIRATAEAGTTGPAEPIFTFAYDGEAPSPLAVPASTVNIRYPAPFGRGGGEAPVDYTWDGSKWLRNQGGRPHVDAAGQQIAVDNAIVRFTNAIDSGTVDNSGTRVPTAEVVGEGEVWVFSKGTVTTGRWVKTSNTERTQYLDADGNEILLTPGTTWVSMPYVKGQSSFR